MSNYTLISALWSLSFPTLKILKLDFNALFFFFLLLCGSHLAMHRGHFCLCTQELLLAVLRGPYGMLGVKPELAACKVHALSLIHI